MANQGKKARILFRKSSRFIIFFLLSFWFLFSLAGEPDAIDRYNPSVVHIGGLSQLLFDRKSNDIIIATEIFFKEVATHIGVEQTKLTIHQSTTEMLNALQAGELDTVFVNPIDYLDLDPYINHKYRYTLTFGENTEQRVKLLTNSLKQVDHIHQLSGKRLSIPRGYLLGKLYLEVLLAEAGINTPEEFFSTINYTRNTNESLLDVFFNKADLAVTSDLAYELAKELNPQIEQKTDVLSTSPPYIPFVIGVSKHVPEDILVDLDAILMQVNSEPRIKQLLSFFSANDLVRVKPEHLDALHSLKRKHQNLLGTIPHE